MSLLLGLLMSLVLSAVAQDPIRPFPLPGSFLSSTSILDHSKYVADLDELQWYLDNIPFVDFPDPQVQQIYYYRASVLKRHLKHTHEGHGWAITEFIQPVQWAGKFMSIPDSAPHHIMETRWLRDPSYTKDLIQLYTRAGLETITGITYTHYLLDAFLEHAQVTGDTEFLVSQLDGMIHMYNLWDTARDNVTGLYHRTPVLDAQEYSLPGWVTGGPNGGMVEVWNSFQNNYGIIHSGPETYRPNLNAYMVAGARAISTVAGLAENKALENTWKETADSLNEKMEQILWNEDIQFWIDVVQGTNQPIVGREVIGLFPYRFGVGTDDKFINGLEASLDEEGFVAEFGPTTLEQRSPYFTAEKNITDCCVWNGQSWPYSTSLYLGTVARLARDKRGSIATAEFFQSAFSTYTRTHYQNGQPAIFESHYPSKDAWSASSTNHSEHYFHSTYLDNVFTNVLGIIPSLSDTFEMKPLVPANWSYFAVEDLPYHGNLLSIIWDKAGTAYQQFPHSRGLSIYSNGELIHNQLQLFPVSISLPPSKSSIAKIAAAPKFVNILSNPNTFLSPQSLPFAVGTSSYDVLHNDLGPVDTGYKANDGLVLYDFIPDNYYTNNGSNIPADWLNFTLPRPRTFSSVTIAVYDDSARGGMLHCPAGLYVYVHNTTTTSPPNEDHLAFQLIPWSTCEPNSRNTVVFNTSVTTDKISLYFLNTERYAFGIPEVEIWVPANPGPRYEAEDGLIGFISGKHYIGRGGGVVMNGGVQLSGNDTGALLEIANVRTQELDGGPGQANITVIGYGGPVIVGINYMRNTTLQLPSTNEGSDMAAASFEADMLAGGNVVTMYQVENQTVWLDAIIVD